MTGGHPDPRVWRRGSPIRATGTSTVVQGLDTVPGRRTSRRSPRSTSSTSRGTSWSGSARCCSCSSRLVRAVLAVPARHAEERAGSCGSPPPPASLVGDHDGGRLGRHRGRPPAVDRLQLHEGRGRRHRRTPACGSRSSSSLRSTSALGVTTILVLRGMSRRFRDAGGGRRADVPVRAERPDAGRRAARSRRRMSDAVAVVLFVGITAYAVFGGADFGAGFWDLIAGRRRARRAAARGDRPLDRPGVGGEPRLADLLPSSCCGPASPRRSRRSR